MIFCPHCGYENRDDSPVCVNCNRSLFSAEGSSEFRTYQQTRLSEIAEASERVMRRKVYLTVCAFIAVILAVAFIAIWIINRPVVDTEIIGTWVAPTNGTKFVFTRDGKCDMEIKGLWKEILVDSNGVPFQAKDGVLTLRPNSPFKTTYTYEFWKAIDSAGNSVPTLVIKTGNIEYHLWKSS